MTDKENNLLVLLETIVLTQMLLENLDTLRGTHYNKLLLKNKLNALYKAIEPLAERDYNTVFGNGQEETIQILNEYQKIVSFISLQKLPSKVALSQFVEAWNKDPKTIEATVHRVVNRKNK